MVRTYSQELGASLPLCGLSAMLQQMLQGHHLWIGRRLGVHRWHGGFIRFQDDPLVISMNNW